MTSGIYTISCTQDSRLYYGFAVNFRRRHLRHWRDLKKGVHCTTPLQNAWNLYGESAFTFTPIVFCKPEDCRDTEQRFLQAFKPVEEMFNVSQSPGPMDLAATIKRKSQALLGNTRTLGRKLTQEHKLQISRSAQINKGNVGRKHSEEIRQNMGKSKLGNTYCKGRVMSPETRKKIGDANRGRPRRCHTEEAKLKIRLSKLGKKRPPFSDEWLRKLSESTKGKPKPKKEYPDVETCINCPPKYGGIRQPKSNCTNCWEYFFKMNPGRVLAIDTGLGLVGKDGVAKVTGDKFLKHYFRFKEKQNAS